MAKLWVLYDDRALTDGTDEATVLATARTLVEARRDRREMGTGVIYEYDVVVGRTVTEPGRALLVNERLVSADGA